jgi:hypothetical protein
MAADIMKSMTEYDYLNNNTRSQEKKIINDFLDLELSVRKNSTKNPSNDHSNEVLNLEI